MEADRIRLYNILTKSWEPEKLDVETTGKQWMVTPCRTALLAVHHSMTGWVADAYALEAAGTVQPLFTQILDEEELPDEVSSLPEEVRHFLFFSEHVFCKRVHAILLYLCRIALVPKCGSHCAAAQMLSCPTIFACTGEALNIQSYF